MKDSAFMVQFENCMFASQSMHPAGNNLKGCSCSSSRSDPYLAWISLLHIKLFSTPCSPTAKILHILKTKLLSIPVYSSPCFLLKTMDLEISWTSFFVGLSNVLIRKSGPSTGQQQLNLMIWLFIRTRIYSSSAIKLGIHIIYPPQCNEINLIQVTKYQVRP